MDVVQERITNKTKALQADTVKAIFMDLYSSVTSFRTLELTAFISLKIRKCAGPAESFTCS